MEWQTRLLLAAMLLALLAGAWPAMAAKQGLSRPLYQKLERAQRLLAKDQPARAVSLLKQARKQAKGNYASAVVLQNLGYAQLQLQRFSAAAASFQAALELQALPENSQQSLRYNLAQILAANGRSAAAVRLLERYLAEAQRPPLRATLLLAQLYAMQERWRKLPPLLSGLAADLPRRSDQQRVLRLLVTAHIALEQPQQALAPLQTLVGWFPDRREYWLRLADAYLALQREADALSVLAAAHLRGALQRGEDISALATLYLRQGIPYRAAVLLQQALDDGQLPPSAANLKRIAQAWEMARAQQATVAALRRALGWELGQELGRERAATPALEGGVDRDLTQRLLRVLQNGQQWRQAADLLQAMLPHASAGNRDRLALQLGISEYRAGRLQQARRAFVELAERDGIAAVSDDTPPRQARQWLDYLDYVQAELPVESSVAVSAGLPDEQGAVQRLIAPTAE